MVGSAGRNSAANRKVVRMRAAHRGCLITLKTQLLFPEIDIFSCEASAAAINVLVLMFQKVPSFSRIKSCFGAYAEGLFLLSLVISSRSHKQP